jgi:hypothetical protein
MKEYKIKITFFFDKKNRKIFYPLNGYPLNGYPLISYKCYNTYGRLKDKKRKVLRNLSSLSFFNQ